MQVCSDRKLGDKGSNFMTPLLGNPKENDLKHLYVQSRTLRAAEQVELRRGGQYAYLIWCRLEMQFIMPHPPLHFLASQPECLWVPFGEDYGEFPVARS
jgi:hypothetical protein